MSDMPYPLNNFHVKESEPRERPSLLPRFHLPETLALGISGGKIALVTLLSVVLVGAGALLTTPGKINVSQDDGVESWNILKEGVQSAADLGAFAYGGIHSASESLIGLYRGVAEAVVRGASIVAINVRSLSDEVSYEYGKIQEGSRFPAGTDQVGAVSILSYSELLARSIYRGVSNLFQGPDDRTQMFAVENNGLTSPDLTLTPATNPDISNAPDVSPEGNSDNPSLQPPRAGASQPISQQTTERIVERVVTVSGISESELSSRLQQLDNKYASKLAEITASNSQQFTNTYHVISQTNKIDNLEGVNISNSTISGGTISGVSTFSGTTGTFSGSLSVGGALTVTGSDISSVASNITFDTNTLVVDAANDRVGIGTTSPYAKLSVTGEVVGANFTATSTATSSFAGPLLASRVPQVAHSFSAWAVNATDAYPLTASLVVNPASASADTNLLALSIAGNAKFLVDAEGDVFANSVTAVGGTTLSTTTASTFSVENNTTLGDATTTDKTYFNSRIGTSLVPTVNNLLDLGDGANGLSWRTGLFATSVGIGTTSPFAKLSVAGIGSFDDYVRASYFVGTSTATSTLGGPLASSVGDFTISAFGTTDDVLLNPYGGNVGVGTTSPWTRFSVTDTVSGAQLAVAYDVTRYATFQVDSAGDLVVNPQGDDAFLTDDNLWVCTGGSCPSNTPTGTGNLIVENKVGVGTTTPTQQLSVANLLYVGAGGASGLGTATSTFQGDIRILGKLDVSTIDPVYTIGGVKYATYGHSTVGVKEEVGVRLEVDSLNTATGRYEYSVDFSTLPRGSDLWLFYQVTDFGEDWQDLVVTLTPGFDGRVFYRLLPEEKKLVVASTEPGSVSLRLFAGRFDASRWSNLRTDQSDPFTNFTLEEKK